jgi:hypothetical protein
MPATAQVEIGNGQIIWLGVNLTSEGFSTQQDTINIHEDGIEDDKYRGMFRKLSSHDGDYVLTDRIPFGEKVLNTRQITIIDEAEVEQASEQTQYVIEHGMLRENIVVKFTSRVLGLTFSKLPPLSRMVISRGGQNLKILNLTEENGPCRKICQPIAKHFGGESELAEMLKENLKGKRGQMAMVRSQKTAMIQVGDQFFIFPPML